MKGTLAVPGGLLKSKPTWKKTLKVFLYVGFFGFWSYIVIHSTEKYEPNEVSHELE